VLRNQDFKRSGGNVSETCAEFRASTGFYGGDDRKSQAVGDPVAIAIVDDAGNLKAYVAKDNERPFVRRHAMAQTSKWENQVSVCDGLCSSPYFSIVPMRVAPAW
jgi:hypothetical protein